MVPVDIFQLVGAYFIGALVVQVIAFVFCLVKKRVDVVDVAWGPSFVGGYLAMQLLYPSMTPVVVVVGLLVFAWGMRLSWHIGLRFVRSSKQDERYTALMSSWPQPNRALQIFLRIFVLQAVLATVVGLAIVATYAIQPALTSIVIIGMLVWFIGYCIEAIADAQLRTFLRIAKPGGLMQQGLWRYSRHPNYFGEIVLWWGLAIVSFATPYWWLGAVGAATITLLICFVSGIPPAEKRMATKRGWQQYRDRTSAVVPWVRSQGSLVQR